MCHVFSLSFIQTTSICTHTFVQSDFGHGKPEIDYDMAIHFFFLLLFFFFHGLSSLTPYLSSYWVTRVLFHHFQHCSLCSWCELCKAITSTGRKATAAQLKCALIGRFTWTYLPREEQTLSVIRKHVSFIQEWSSSRPHLKSHLIN